MATSISSSSGPSSSSPTTDRKAITIRLSLKSGAITGTSLFGNSTSRHHVVAIPLEMTFEELNVMTRGLFFQQDSKISSTNKSSSIGQDIEYWTGYPPKRLPISMENMSMTKTLVHDYIQGGENVLVSILTINNSSNSNEEQPEKASQSLTISQSNKPTKRKAAEVAQANFVNQIHAQEKLLRQEEEDRTKNKRSTRHVTSKKLPIASTTANNNNNNNNNRSKIHSIHDKNMNRSPSNKNTSKKDHTSHVDTKEEMSVSLLSLFQPGATTSHGDYTKFKASLRQAVISAHEERIATVRFASISSNSFHESTSSVIVVPYEEEIKNSRSEKDCTRTTIYSLSLSVPEEYTSGSFCIRYPKGIEGRGYFEDVIDILSLSTLQSVVESVYNMDKDHENEDDTNTTATTGISTGQDLLRPRNIALLSPRVFWSIWFHYKHTTLSMEEALHKLLPNLDWNYLLTSRVREKSEKAKENERQEFMKHKKKTGYHDEDKYDEYQAIKHISDVENAMEFFLQNKQRHQRMSRVADTLKTNGGQVIGRGTSDKKTWVLITPSEEDIDELIECMTEGIESKKENRNLAPIYQEYAQVLSTQCSIHNWREVANIIHVSDFCNQFQTAAKGHNPNVREVTESEIERWIEMARMKSIDEIMLEILDSDDDMYFTLREKLQCGTPKDLKLWKKIPCSLMSELKPFLAETKKSQDSLTEEMIHEWCERAEIAMNTCPWLDDYITPLA